MFVVFRLKSNAHIYRYIWQRSAERGGCDLHSILLSPGIILATQILQLVTVSKYLIKPLRISP